MSTAFNQNLKLVYSSLENPLINIQTDELKKILKQAIAVNDLQTMANMTNLYTQSFISIEYKPIWLKSAFENDNWEIEFPKSKNFPQSSSTVVPWNKIQLDDGTFLIEPQHSKLLNTFKRWVLNIDNPALNAGRLSNLATSRNNLYRVLRLIECIIFNARAINLSKMHLSLISTEFLLDILVSMSTVDTYGAPIYLRFEEHTRNELIKASSAYEATENKKCLLNIFNFTTDEYNRANNFIIEKFVTKSNVFDYSKFKKFIFNSNKKILPIKSNSFIKFMVHRDYHPIDRFFGLYHPSQSTLKISNIKNDDEVGALNLMKLIKSLKQLSFSANQERMQLDHTAFSKLNFNTVARLVDIAESGRFKTLPVMPMLDLMRDTFEFSFKNIDEILESVVDVFEFQVGKKNITLPLNRYSRKNFTNLVNRLYPERLVCGAYIGSNINIDIKKASLHSNTLINRYNILITSIQFLFSVFSAKRSNEINSLNPQSNLVPDINPDDTDYNTHFSIQSIVMKTGVGGDNGTKAITQRPIIRSIARLMWKVESFNKKIIQLGIDLPRLFNLLGGAEKNLKFTDLITTSPYTYICDYFETPFINENGIPKKLYFSNHQLRRFFAMMFFWTNGYDGLDAIRWMLGHSSSEHLYHYITESNNGAVLNGIKAAHLVSEVQNGQLETIDVLRKAISKYYDVEQANIELERISDAIRDYIDDEDFETKPSHISAADLNAIENTIYKLLHDDVIRLEPEFFTIERGGITVQDYRMILEVREIC